MTHLDASILSAYAEGLLRPRKRAKTASHLAACPACARTLQQLAGVAEVLAAVPAPPMPAAVSERLDAALAAEAARSRQDSATAAGLAGLGADAGGGAARRGPATRRGRGRRRLAAFPLAARLATVAAALALLGGGGYAISQSAGVQTGASGSGSSAMSKPAGHAPAAATGNAPHLDAGVITIASGTRYQPGALASQVRAVLARFSSPNGKAAPGIPSMAQRTFGNDTVTACAAAVAAGRRLVLIDVARYAGRPVAVIVTQAGTAREAQVVPRDCAAGHTRVIARALLPAG